MPLRIGDLEKIHIWQRKREFGPKLEFCNFSEKLRALIQGARPRDLYDAISLFNLKEKLDDQLFKSTLKNKFDYK